MAITFRKPVKADGPAITQIDTEGLATGMATFRDTPHTWESFAEAWLAPNAVGLLAENQGQVLAYAGTVPLSSRCVYAGVGEVSIYIAEAARGQGLGRTILSHLIQTSEAQGYWTLVAEIFTDNAPSIALHKTCGFQELGIRRALGKMSYGPHKGQWRDVTMLEYRSTTVGID